MTYSKGLNLQTRKSCSARVTDRWHHSTGKSPQLSLDSRLHHKDLNKTRRTLFTNITLFVDAKPNLHFPGWIFHISFCVEYYHNILRYYCPPCMLVILIS